MAFTDWSSTPILNADVPGISWHDRPQNTMVVATSARQMMADLVVASSSWDTVVGSVSLTAATTATVTFLIAQPDTSYFTQITPLATNAGCWVTSKTTAGFVVNFGVAYTGAVDWLVKR